MAAQIRQYFVQFNVSMTPSVGCHYHNASHYDMTCDHLSNPRGATLKALLINSGEPMSQYDNQNLNTIQASMILTSVPNYYQVILASITPSFILRALAVYLFEIFFLTLKSKRYYTCTSWNPRFIPTKSSSIPWQ